jgi:hypothetical protein
LNITILNIPFSKSLNCQRRIGFFLKVYADRTIGDMILYSLTVKCIATLWG